MGLRLHFPTLFQGKTLSCTAENKVFGSQNKSIELNVYYVPVVHVEIETDLDPGNIREGDTVTMRCHIQAHPWVWRILWYAKPIESFCQVLRITHATSPQIIYA